MRRARIFLRGFLAGTVFLVLLGLAPARGAESVPADKAKVAEAIRDLRAKSAQWQLEKARLVLMEFSDEDTSRWEADYTWVAPNKVRLDVRVDGSKEVVSISVWDDEGLWEYDLDAGEAMKVDVRTLGRQFPADVLTRCGLSQQSDPFQGMQEETIQLVGDETLNGEKTKLFEAKLWPQFFWREPVPSKILFWVGTEDGLVRRTETYDAKGKRLFSQTVSITEKALDNKGKAETPRPQGEFKWKDKTKEIADWLKTAYKKDATKPKE